MSKDDLPTTIASSYYDSKYFAPEIVIADYQSWSISSSVVGMARASSIARFKLVAQAHALNAHFLNGDRTCSCGLAIPENQPKGFQHGLAAIEVLNRFGHINHKDQTYTTIFLTARVSQPHGPFYGWELTDYEWYCQVCYLTWNVERTNLGEFLPAGHWHPDQYRNTKICSDLKTPREFAWAFLYLVGKDRMKYSVVLSKQKRKRELAKSSDTPVGP